MNKSSPEKQLLQVLNDPNIYISPFDVQKAPFNEVEKSKPDLWELFQLFTSCTDIKNQWTNGFKKTKLETLQKSLPSPINVELFESKLIVLCISDFCCDRMLESSESSESLDSRIPIPFSDLEPLVSDHGDLEDLLCEAIASKCIQAKVDSCSKTLWLSFAQTRTLTKKHLNFMLKKMTQISDGLETL